MDVLRIRDLSVEVRIGALPEEHVTTQQVQIDVELHTDMTSATRTDRLDDALDYLEVATRVRTVAEGKVFRLVERLCREVLDEMLTLPGVASARVAARKFNLPGMGAVGHVEIELSSGAP